MNPSSLQSIQVVNFYLFKPEFPARASISVSVRLSVCHTPNLNLITCITQLTLKLDFALLGIRWNSNQNSRGIPQSAAAAFPTRILIDLLEEFQPRLMYLTLKLPAVFWQKSFKNSAVIFSIEIYQLFLLKKGNDCKSL